MLVVFVFLMGVGFAFKGDIEICSFCVAILQQPHQPFHNIPYKESYEQQLALLEGVDVLMTPFGRGKTLLGKDHTTEVDSIEVLAEREYGVEDNQLCYFF